MRNSRTSESVKMDCLIACNATSSAMYSNKFSLKDYPQGAIIVTAGTQTTGAGLIGYLVAGNSTTAPSGMTQVTGSSFVVSYSGSTITSGNEVGIALKGTISTASTGVTVVVNGVTLTGATAGSATGLTFIMTDATAAAASLATVIAAVCTDLETTFSGSGTAADVRIRCKEGVGARSISVATTACATASSDKIGAYRINQSAIIDFKASEIVAQNATYTHAALYLLTTESSVIPYTACLIRQGGRFGVSQASTSYADTSTLTT